MAIKSFKHNGLKKFFESGSKKGIQAAHSKKIARVLDRLDAASKLEDLAFPGSDFHSLKGDLAGYYSIHVNGNWVIIFQFDGKNIYNVELIDYH